MGVHDFEIVLFPRLELDITIGFFRPYAVVVLSFCHTWVRIQEPEDDILGLSVSDGFPCTSRACADSVVEMVQISRRYTLMHLSIAIRVYALVG